ncbi:MAG TPA: carboxypeptidase-like regulatory domain-containing protein, partial [Burkholderiales bacterium]|nr:carboxypeptidase-like regulatory domain-containing protein [Burkholderiales bacterium]
MHKQKITRVIAASAVSLAILAMYGCGGSDGVATSSTTPAPAPDPTISGVVASGAPIPNASITITCADGTTKTATADANGAYSVNVKDCTAPFVITATGQVGESQQTLVSVQPTTVVDVTTINVTP